MLRSRLLPIAAAAVLTVGLAAAPSLTSAASAAPALSAALPAVYPTPHSMTALGAAVRLGTRVAVVTGAGADAATVRAVRSVLVNARVRSVDTVKALNDARPGEAAVIVDPAQADGALAAFGVDGPGALADEGYVLATGRRAGRPVVVLDGKDATGSFYAAQTLRQLVVARHGRQSVPGVRVRDWPTYPLRGTIEGFYGTPWSDAARLRQMDFYGAHKMNTYVYSPKDDAYLRAKWRDPYPAAQLAQLKRLVTRARANHVEFTYALSPGLSVCYSSAADATALIDKFQTLWDIGVRTFAVPLDDISYTKWNCAADQSTFGTGGGAAGAAQSYLLNAVQKRFIGTHPGASRLEMVATEYYDQKPTPYKAALKADLDPNIVVEWTGQGVVVPTITTAQAAEAKQVFGHDILVWDNYPVNDYVTNRLLLGPYTGRDVGMSGSLYGLTANPMIQPEASKIALFTVADFLWNDAAYDEQTSWRAGIDELAGADRQARAALLAFADLEYSSRLDPRQAPILAAKIAAFWSAGPDGSGRADRTLRSYLDIVSTVRSTLASRMHDAAFVADADPWLRSAEAWGRASTAALDMLAAQRAGDGAAAEAARARVVAWRTKATSYRYVGLGGTVPVTVGDGVVDAFVDRALARNDAWLGLPPRVTAVTNLPTYQSNTPAKMVDGDDATYFWASRNLATGDTVGVDLGAVQPITHVTVNMAKSGSPDDYVHDGVLESSVDGTTWTTLGTTHNSATVDVSPSAGTSARYVRLRVTADQAFWAVVREFSVTTPNSGRSTVTGTPVAAAGSSLAAAADGSVDTSYVAASAPADGDALTVTLPKARTVRRVVVVGTGSASVEVRVGGLWRTLGSLHARYSELRAYGVTADAVRLAWRSGSSAPRIAEVIVA